MNAQPTIFIDLDTLNDGADVAALIAAVEAEFPEANVETGYAVAVPFRGFADEDDARARFKAVCDRAEF